MEKQITFNGKSCVRPRRVVSPLYLNRILKEFYRDYSDIGLSLVELNRKFRGIMHPNTVKNSIHYAHDLKLITLCARNVGPNKRRKYYKITEKGALLLEKYGKI